MSTAAAAAPAQATPPADAKAPEQVTTPPAAAAPEAPKAPEGDKSGEAKADPKTEVPKAEKPEEQKPVVPEKYDLKLPEGSILDAGTVERVALIAKERGLTQQQAETLLQDRNEAVASYVEGATAHLQKLSSEVWPEQAKADPEIGGVGGQAFTQNVELAHRAFAAYGGESFTKLMNDTGYGNHPEVIRVFSRIGKAMAEDKLVTSGSQPTGEEASAASILYGNKTQ